MNKRRPPHELSKVKALIRAGQFYVTKVGLQSGASLDIVGEKAIGDVLLTLTHADFYKSMTTDNNSKEWQDVYHVHTPSGEAIYTKFTIRDGVVVLSFKRKSEEK